MARKLGSDFRVYIGDGASSETFTVVAGQLGLTRDDSTNLINQSSKETGKYALQTPGRSQLQITCNGVLVTPDANGLEAVHTAAIADPVVAHNFRICDASVSPIDVYFEGSMYVGNWNQGADDQQNATYSFTLTAAAAPTTDDLSP